MPDILISVVVPVYNVEKYLSKCLSSIIHQTYKNIEIILVDDGSSDKSGFICEEYALNDKRIKVIHQTNSGVSSARKLGFLKASGNIIIFIDSDDYIENGMIEKMYQNMIETGSDIVMCKDINVYNSKLKFRKWPKKSILLNRNIALKYIAMDKIKSFFGNKMFKRSILKENDFIIDRHFEDFLAMPNIFNRVNKVSIMDLSLYYYVRHENSSTFNNRKSLNFFKACYERSEWFKNFLPEYYEFALIRLVSEGLNLLNANLYNDERTFLKNILKKSISIKMLIFNFSIKEKLILLRFFV